VQIEISICGYLTGIGMVLHAATDSTFRFALYTDYGGNPTTLLAQTDKVAVSGTTEDAMVGRVVAVGCGDQSVPYWVCWTSSAQGIQLDAIPASSSRWTRITAPTQIATWINSGFPETWPQSNPVELPTPLIYTWVAPLAP
jgi:hypothetical protein